MITTYFAIKPDAFEYREAMKKIIIDNGFIIHCSRIIIANNRLISDILYKNDEEWLRSCHKKFFDNKPIELGCLGGGSLESFSELVGKEADPKVCPKGSLRNAFGGTSIVINGFKYFVNAIHRPINREEFQASIEGVMQFCNV